MPRLTPSSKAPYELNQKELKELKIIKRATYKYLLIMGIFKKKNCLMEHPFWLSIKKDNKLKMCIDYHALNKVTIKK